MVKSLHQSLEAKLSAFNDSDSDVEMEENNENNDPVTISAEGSKSPKRKQKTVDSTENTASDKPSRIIYLGHLPPGFEEKEIQTFLNQFGNVSKCRVSRSKKSGRPRGYAFVQFADHEVAKVVADTMSGYFLLEKRLVCHILPADKVHKNMFASTSKRPFSKGLWQKRSREESNKKRSSEGMQKITARLVKREELKRKKFESLGIEYDFPGYAAAAVIVPPVEAEKKEGEPNKKRQKVSAVSDKSNVTIAKKEEVDETNTESPGKLNRKQKRKNAVAKKSTEVAEKKVAVDKSEIEKDDVAKSATPAEDQTAKSPESKASRKKKRKKSADETVEVAVPKTAAAKESTKVAEKIDAVDKSEIKKDDVVKSPAAAKRARQKEKKRKKSADEKVEGAAPTNVEVKTISKDTSKSEPTEDGEKVKKSGKASRKKKGKESAVTPTEVASKEVDTDSTTAKKEDSKPDKKKKRKNSVDEADVVASTKDTNEVAAKTDAKKEKKSKKSKKSKKKTVES